MLDVEGFILVGGASSRMGQDKAQLTVDGRTTVSWIADSMRRVTTRITLVGSPAGPGDAPLPSISDVQHRWGPLGGIQAALRVCRTDYSIIVACDLPFVTTELFEYLVSSAGSSAAAEAVIPLQEDGRPQPLCAVYKRDPCLSAAEESIAKNDHSPRAMLDKVKTQYVGFSELANLTGSEFFFFNLNRQEDYERAKQIAANIRSIR